MSQAMSNVFTDSSWPRETRASDSASHMIEKCYDNHHFVLSLWTGSAKTLVVFNENVVNRSPAVNQPGVDNDIIAKIIFTLAVLLAHKSHKY